MKKRLISLLTSIMMIFGLTMVVPIDANVGAYTSRTRDEALDWVRSMVGTGIDYDGAYGNQCVDLIKAYYNFLGVEPVRGNGSDYVNNTLPSGWQRIQGAAPQPGDILVYTGGEGGYGHVAIYEADRIHYHQNFYDKNKYPNSNVVQCIGYMYNGLSNPYWGVIRPDFNTNEIWYDNLTPLDFGESFDALIIAQVPWKTIRADTDGNVILKSEEGTTSEMWRFIKNTDGSYTIYNFYNKNVLDAYGLGTTNKTNVFTADYNGGLNQRWFIYSKNNGYVIRAAYTDMVLDIDGGNFESETNIQMYEQNNSDAQTFTFYYENSTYGVPRRGEITAKSNGNSITLNIQKSSYTDYFRIYRSIDNENFKAVAEITDLSYTDENLNYNKEYYYKIEYVNRYYTEQSDAICITTDKEMTGDLNQDNTLTMTDAVFLQKHLLTLKDITAEQLKLADMNSDGKVNIFDLALLKESLKQ